MTTRGDKFEKSMLTFLCALPVWFGAKWVRGGWVSPQIDQCEFLNVFETDSLRVAADLQR